MQVVGITQLLAPQHEVHFGAKPIVFAFKQLSVLSSTVAAQRYLKERVIGSKQLRVFMKLPLGFGASVVLFIYRNQAVEVVGRAQVLQLLGGKQHRNCMPIAAHVPLADEPM